MAKVVKSEFGQRSFGQDLREVSLSKVPVMDRRSEVRRKYEVKICVVRTHAKSMLCLMDLMRPKFAE